MKPFIFILLIGCMALSCTKSDFVVSGKYYNPQYNFLDGLFFRLTNKKLVVGCSLEVNRDSTFIYSTCGNVITGSWETRSDSLFLYPISNRWRSDSLSFNGYNDEFPIAHTDPIIFKMIHSNLEQVMEANAVGRKVVNKLHKQTL